MGRTNIRNGAQLLQGGSKYGYRDSVCCIPDASLPTAEKLVLTSSGPCDKVEFESLQLDGYADPVIIPPPPVKIPRIFSSIGTSKFWEPIHRRIGEPEPKQPANLLFIAVIAGNCGTGVMKLLTTLSLDTLRSLVFAEALNGYSTVFTGACFETEWARRLQGSVKWQSVQTLEELEALKTQNSDPEYVAAPEIGIVC